MVNPCECSKWVVAGGFDRNTGCSEVAKKRFAMGHDSKLKSLLVFAGREKVNVCHVDGEQMSPLEAAARYGFVTQVTKGIERPAKVAKVKVPKPAKAPQAEQPKPCTIKLGRWTYQATVGPDGSASYVDRKGATITLAAGAFQVVK